MFITKKRFNKEMDELSTALLRLREDMSRHLNQDHRIPGYYEENEIVWSGKYEQKGHRSVPGNFSYNLEPNFVQQLEETGKKIKRETNLDLTEALKAILHFLKIELIKSKEEKTTTQQKDCIRARKVKTTP